MFNKRDEFEAVNEIVQRFKIRSNYYFENFKESFDSKKNNISIDNLNKIEELQSYLNTMATCANELQIVQKIEKELAHISTMMNLGINLNLNDQNRENIIKNQEKSWKKQYHDLKTKSPDFKTIILDEAHTQLPKMEELGVSISLGADKNDERLSELLKNGKIDKGTFICYSLCCDYLQLERESDSKLRR